MKTRLLFILAIIIGFSSTFTQEFVFGENLDDEFQNAMKRCTEQSKVFAYGTVIQNSTHYFDDTISCFIFDNRMIKGSNDVSAEKRVYENLPDFLKPPLKQLKLGVPIDEIQCNEDLVLLQKHDGFPACVKPETKRILIERGWTQESSASNIHILRYSPVVFKGTGMEITGGQLSFEDLQKLEQRKLELDMLLDDKTISEKMNDERKMIQHYAQLAFDEKVPWDLVKIL